MKKYVESVLLLLAVFTLTKFYAANTEQQKSFSLIMASDVQIVSKPSFDDYNISRVRAGMVLNLMNRLIRNSEKSDSKSVITGCLINGDMAQGVETNYEGFMLGYDNSYSIDSCKSTMRSSDHLLYNNKLKTQVFPGMGNHDFNRRIKDDNSDFALSGWECIDKVARSNNPHSSDNYHATHTCILEPLSFPMTTQSGLSLNKEEIYEVYFVDIGTWRFIQTNWGMTDRKYKKLIAIMEDAAKNKLNIAVCGHYFLDDREAEGVRQLQAYFVKMAEDNNKSKVRFLPYLKALICGHVHDKIGLLQRITFSSADGAGDSYQVPLYYCGCSGWFNRKGCVSPLHFMIMTFTDSGISNVSIYHITEAPVPYLRLNATDREIPEDSDLSKLSGYKWNHRSINM